MSSRVKGSQRRKGEKGESWAVPQREDTGKLQLLMKKREGEKRGNADRNMRVLPTVCEIKRTRECEGKGAGKGSG